MPFCVQRILHARYSIPPHVRLSRECLDLLGRIFQADPTKRMTLDQLRQHPWFVENLPEELQVRVAGSPTAPSRSPGQGRLLC